MRLTVVVDEVSCFEGIGEKNTLWDLHNRLQDIATEVRLVVASTAYQDFMVDTSSQADIFVHDIQHWTTEHVAAMFNPILGNTLKSRLLVDCIKKTAPIWALFSNVRSAYFTARAIMATSWFEDFQNGSTVTRQ